MPTATPAPNTTLDLLDWRRRIAHLYAHVRLAAAADPKQAWQLWRDGRDQLFEKHPQTALSATQVAEFRRLHYFDYDPALRFAVPVALSSATPRASIATSTDGALQFTQFGTVTLPFGTLPLYWLDQYGGGVFLPFRDGTSGSESYAGCRYLLDTVKSADLGSEPDGRLILDFNFAFNPSCHYDPQWSCPLAPLANRLATRIEAGEKRYV